MNKHISEHPQNIDNSFLVVECLQMGWETGVQSQVIIPKTQKMVLDTSLLNTQH